MRIVGPGVWGPPADPAEAKRVLKRAVELGVNFIDTADSYGPAVSEPLIGGLGALSQRSRHRNQGGPDAPGPRSVAACRPAQYLQQQVEMSLRFLRTDVIDLWQLHRIDPKVPVEESLAVIVKLQKQGKIRHIGLSEVKVPEIEQARQVAKIVSVQNIYNLGDRRHEDVVQYCQAHEIAFIPGSLSRPASWPNRAANWTRCPSGTAQRWRSFRCPGCSIAVR